MVPISTTRSPMSSELTANMRHLYPDRHGMDRLQPRYLGHFKGSEAWGWGIDDRRSRATPKEG